ncbi:aspartate kinase [Seinonella peptonophila]|nr:aspartate kinase [Seinonella peptonophila]
MGVVVQKYGGTSVGSVERIQNVAERIQKTLNEGHQCVVVVSAMGKQTDELISLAKQISPHPPAREMDMLLTTGEQITIALLTMALQAKGIKARSFTGWQAGVNTNSIHGKASVTHVESVRLQQSLSNGEVAVVAGFQGVSIDGEITTLGRGGSDTTAVTLAAALQADYCEINTDVSGVFTADPRVVAQATKMDEISFEEMLELARLGAGVLHPRSVECALMHRVPLVVRSSFVDEPGTWLKEASQMEQTLSARGVAHDSDVARVKILGLPNQPESLPHVFSLLADEHINVDMIVQSEHDQDLIDVAFSLEESDGENAKRLLKSLQSKLAIKKVLYEDELAKVSVVGVGMMTRPGVAAKMFTTLSQAGIRIKMVSTSEIKISCLIDRAQTKEAVQLLHTAFELDAKQPASV